MNKVKQFMLLFVFVGCLMSCNRNAANRDKIPVEDFFTKAERSHFKLSPDGQKIAYLGLDDHCKNIFILDLVDAQASKQLTYQANMNVQHFFWASDTVLIYSNSQHQADSLRLFAIDLHTEKSTAILPTSRYKLRWTEPLIVYDNYLYASINERDSTVFDLYRVYLDGRDKELVTLNPGNISDWYASPDGQVRLAMTSDSVHETILYRAHEQAPFMEVDRNSFNSTIQPLGFVHDSSAHIYALSNINRDKLALVEYDIVSGKEVRTLYAHPQVDLDRQGYHKSSRAMLYASYTVDKVDQHFFSATLADTYKKLQAHFPKYLVEIVEVDHSLQHLIARVFTDTDPGGIYYYNAAEDQIQELSKVNPKISGYPMASMQSVQFQSRDGLTLNAYLTYPSGMEDAENLPVVALVHDGPGRREKFEFDTEAQFLANRGYLVMQINYRGSSGYGKKFWQAGFKQWGGNIQLDIIDGLTWLIHQGKADKDRIAIMGNGFGGYSALYGATFNSSFFRCAIAMSGYTNLFTYFKEIPPQFSQYVQLYYQIIGNPNLESELFKTISPVFHADKVKIPVFFAQGGRDRFSSVTDANRFVQRLKNNGIPVTYLYKEDEGRRFRNEENIISYYQAVEAFLSTHLTGK